MKIPPKTTIDPHICKDVILSCRNGIAKRIAITGGEILVEDCAQRTDILNPLNPQERTQAVSQNGHVEDTKPGNLRDFKPASTLFGRQEGSHQDCPDQHHVSCHFEGGSCVNPCTLSIISLHPRHDIINRFPILGRKLIRVSHRHEANQPKVRGHL